MTWESNAPPDRGPGRADTESVVAAQFDGADDSSGSDLLQEFAKTAARAAQPQTAAWFARHGIGRDVIFGPHCSLVGAARIEIDGQHYQPVESGRPAIILPVSWSYAPCELEPVDLVAWQPGRSDGWYLRKGDAVMLGEASIDRVMTVEEPLTLHQTPLDWIQAGLDGAVILDWCACLSLYLGNVRRIIADSPALARQTKRKLDEERCWPMPEIRVVRGMADAA